MSFSLPLSLPQPSSAYIVFTASPSEHRHLARICAGARGIRGP